MADSQFPTLVSRTRDSNSATNTLFVAVSDGVDTALVTAGGALNVIANSNSGVDIGDVDVTSVIPGTGATNLGKAEDAAHTTGDVGVMLLSKRTDAAASSAGTDGDYATINTSANGDVYVTLDSETVTVGTITTSVVPGTGATHLGKAEDAAHTTGDTGVMALAVRDDAGATLSSATGDYEPLHLDASGNLRVAGTFSPADNKAEDAAHTSGDTGSFALGVRNDAAGTTFTSANGDYSPIAVDSAGRIGISDLGGSISVDDNASSLTVDGTVTVDTITTSVTPGTGATHLGKAEDAAHTTGDVGVMLLSKRTDVAASSAGTDGDYATINTNSAGDMYVTLDTEIVRISATTAANSATNPIYVQVVSTGVLANEIHNYSTSSAVASDATSNHDYTVTGTTFLLKSVIFSVSGGGKAEVQTGPVATLVSIAVGFVPQAGGTVTLKFDPPREVPSTSTGTIRVIRTNRAGAVQDVYSTIIGNDVA